MRRFTMDELVRYAVGRTDLDPDGFSAIDPNRETIIAALSRIVPEANPFEVTSLGDRHPRYLAELVVTTNTISGIPINPPIPRGTIVGRSLACVDGLNGIFVLSGEASVDHRFAWWCSQDRICMCPKCFTHNWKMRRSR